MEHDVAPVIAGISIVCPGCGAVEPEDFEVLDLDEMHAITCDACKRRFHLMIAECEVCGSESALTWVDVPTPDQIKLATCYHCGDRLTVHGDDLRSMGQVR